MQKGNSNEEHHRYRIERKLQTERSEQYKTRARYCNEEFEEKTIVSIGGGGTKGPHNVKKKDRKGF